MANEKPSPESENYCHDKAAWSKLDGLLKSNPHDPLVIRGYALRKGICSLIDEGKIDLKTGIEAFEVERQRLIMERAAEKAMKEQRKPVPDDDVEPQG